VNNNIVLTCKKTVYYSPVDEELFFTWIEKIPSIIKDNGAGDEYYLYIKNHKIPDMDLREVIALFYKYDIEMTQLKQFLNDDNKKWFYDNKQAFWHEKVFGEN
jgi:hypothetical protein